MFGTCHLHCGGRVQSQVRKQFLQTCSFQKKKKKERKKEDFPGGAVVKNPLSNEGVAGLIPDQGTCHMAIKPECGN